MGYYSDVRIRTTKKGYEVMKKEVEKFLENKPGYDNLLNANFAKINIKDEVVTIDFEDVKWYEHFIDVMAITNSLKVLDEQGIDYQYMRIGEDVDDVEEIWQVNNDSFESFSVTRTFTD